MKRYSTFPKSSRTETAVSDSLLSSSGHLLKSYPSIKIQSAYSTDQPIGLVQVGVKSNNNNNINNNNNNQKRPGDLREVAVTQTPVKDRQLTKIGVKDSQGGL